jgi:hypothetical protein
MHKTHKMEISFWQGKDNSIHISLGKDTATEITGIATVNGNDKSKRGNPHLFMQLKEILKSEGK